MNWRHPALAILGLNSTELRILECISVPKSVQRIAQTISMSRTGVNHSLHGLMEKGLARSLPQGKRSLYVAFSSDEMRAKFNAAAEIIPIDTNSGASPLSLPRTGDVTIYMGTREIIPAYSRIAAHNKNERIKAIQHHRSWRQLLEHISNDQLIAFNQAIKKNHLIVDGMLNESAYTDYHKEILRDPKKYGAAVRSLEGRMADYTVFPDTFFNYDAEFWLFKNTTLIINWRDEIAVEIRNPHITGFLRDMFEFVKMGGRKLDHNMTLRKILSEKKA